MFSACLRSAYLSGSQDVYIKNLNNVLLLRCTKHYILPDCDANIRYRLNIVFDYVFSLFT